MSDHYTYRVTWSEDDKEFVGLCAEFPSISHLAPTKKEALAGIEDLVHDVVKDMQENGEPVPEPIAEQEFSGEFTTRIPKDLHRRLTLEAAEARMSLSRLVNYKLTAPPPPPPEQPSSPQTSKASVADVSRSLRNMATQRAVET